MSTIKLTDAQREAKDAVKTGIKCLQHEEERVDFLIKVASGNTCALGKEGYFVVLKDVADLYFEGSVGDLCKRIREQLACPGDRYSDLFAGMCWLIEDIITNESQNEISLRLWFNEAVYFSRVIVRMSRYSGTAKKLLRTLAEKCSSDLLDDLTGKFEEDLSEDMAILDALAEGSNRREGAWNVRKRSRSFDKRRNELEEELRLLCDLADPDQKQLDNRREAFSALSDLIGDEAARKFIEEGGWDHLFC